MPPGCNRHSLRASTSANNLYRASKLGLVNDQTKLFCRLQPHWCTSGVDDQNGGLGGQAGIVLCDCKAGLSALIHAKLTTDADALTITMKRKAAQSSPPVPNSKASKPTSSQPSGNQNIIEIDSDEVNCVDMDDSDSENPTKSQSLKRSWVWLHFKEEVGPQAENLAVCQVVQRGGKLCGASMKRDKSKSMKNLHGHLYNMHKLADPKLLKKTKKLSHIDIRTWAKKGECKPKDTWTAPNCTAFMGVTSHFIDEKFCMRDLTLAVPHIQGSHTGKMFVNLFYDVLESYRCLGKVNTITANNASVNNKMARELSLQIREFDTSTSLLGCIAHVINLASKAGIAALGTMEDEEDCGDQEISTVDMGASHPTIPPPPQMAISFVTTEPNGANIDANSILKRVHGLCTYVRFSPQCCE
ncbi:uncharacterized protein PGTG_19708 [Puccinia graminis f. sp. tritici CRL 75-36-700-3]|uniref:BED-type domain-containing protein n=1 Tax=Puccinia graminis f. sp. tritici (strain CRL 75-36-700-3 / race SCCL) TaxID=418459 RepID=E3LBC9_PUCGT|nr:uncharacterized protein PGTG_19708 [Puccinia graminis f. sp. tritici CRL 75-36-700-3]EFP93854.1 hypothetical protein PGTG_19708 [Puccinia graminis f. sp. tritici CRL 75-36-700-3]